MPRPPTSTSERAPPIQPGERGEKGNQRKRRGRHWEKRARETEEKGHFFFSLIMKFCLVHFLGRVCFVCVGGVAGNRISATAYTSTHARAAEEQLKKKEQGKRGREQGKGKRRRRRKNSVGWEKKKGRRKAGTEFVFL